MCNILVVIPIKYFPNLDTRIPFAKLHQMWLFENLQPSNFPRCNPKTENKGARKEIDEDRKSQLKKEFAWSIESIIQVHNTLKTY
ncbi:hypothetical protein ACJIZ3_023538 [Penstemon smallii]|uniref:Uncharacterized protein n=1 Tax=Penstemon smallii TaxID=265156 RepID=A0ABD3TQA4_9LAMI